MTTRTPPWAQGMEKLAPGMYLDGQEMHFCVAEICKDLGIAITEENAHIVEDEIKKTMREFFGRQIPTEVVESPEEQL